MKSWRKSKSTPFFSRNSPLISIIILFILCTSIISISRASDSIIITIFPANQTIFAGDTINISINCSSPQSIKAFQFDLSFNPRLLQVTSVSEGNYFEGYPTFFNPGTIDNIAGTIANIYCLIIGPGNVTNTGTFIAVNFTAKSATGTTTFRFKNLNVTNEEAVLLPVEVTTTMLTVIGPSHPSSSQNQPPSSPMKPQGPAFITVGVPYVFNSSAVDPDSEYIRLRFDWGDDSISNWTEFVNSNATVSASHIWHTISNFTIRVIAQDDDLRNSSWSDPLIVIGFSPPIVRFIIPPDVSVNETILFNASGCQAFNGIIVSYYWDFGDGINGTGKTSIHYYQFLGQYNVTLSITDDSGMTYSKIQMINVSTMTSEVSNNTLLPFSLGALVFIIIFGIFLSGLVISRERIRAFLIHRAINSSRRRLTRFDRRSKTVEKILDKKITTVEEILDSIFLDKEKKTTKTNVYNIFNANHDLTNNYIEKKNEFRSSDQSETIENLIEDRVHAMIAEWVDKL